MNEHTSSDARGRRIAFVAHCLLNQNAKVPGLAGYPGVFQPLCTPLTRHGIGIVQMRCPEMDHLGPGRPLGTDTIDQYDTPAYRDLCRRLAGAVATEAAVYHAAGYRVLFALGVEGSPSCSVSNAPVLEAGCRILRPGRGLFMEALAAAFAAAGLQVPFIGIPEVPESGELDEALSSLEVVVTCAGE
ncbi:hypothetical protein JXA88_12930 [Candidatus Fermentibacteria bacterium]|nr:hypothetical protein [Candidatus Fermentibacteria bacterium]